MEVCSDNRNTIFKDTEVRNNGGAQERAREVEEVSWRGSQPQGS